MDDAVRAHARDISQAIREGHLDPAAFADALQSVPFADRDGWVDEVLGLEPLVADVADLPEGAVPYLPCGVDAIVRAVLDAPVKKSDVFVDLGAGLGRAAMLVHLLTGARAVGVELQAPLVARARRTAERLGLTQVSFVLGDAGSTPVVDGTVFFSYASFSPTVLVRVLGWLEPLASRRRVVLCAVDFEVPGQSWLAPRPSASVELALYESTPVRF